ncbi:Ig-like domain-containing protein [Mycolicibacter minnesotensis]
MLSIVFGGAGVASAAPPMPSALAAQAQNVVVVTTTANPVSAGLIATPASAGTQFAVVTPPEHGTVTVNAATFTYTPTKGYVGTDAFSYAATDGVNVSTPATVGIQVASASSAPPSLATACTDLGPAFTPVCSAIGDVTDPVVQACSTVGSLEACSWFGGNKHGLISACFDVATGQLATTCKALDSAAQLVASQCRVINGPIDYCALRGGSPIGDRSVQNYLAGPVHKALAQQYLLSRDLPLREVQLPATHNSYNYTNANTPPTLSGMDPDQLYSMVHQLNMDIRALEVDIHWYPSLGAPGGYAPIICHGFTNHLGCTFEQPAANRLQQIRGWLDANPDEVIVLYVENRLDDPVDDITKSLPAGAAVIESTLGATSGKDLLFRPEQVSPGGTCDTQPFPLDVTLDQIHASGKQVLLYTSGCGKNAAWDALGFNDSNVIEKGQPVKVQYPDCYFSRAQFDNNWTRFFDSNTLVDVLAGGGAYQPMTGAEINETMRCGTNAPGLNFVDPQSAQLGGFMWSWSYGQPVASPTQQCAVHNGDGRFQAESCGQFLPYACQDANGWHISSGTGQFGGGAVACLGHGGFAVPRNGYQNQLLTEAKAQAGVDRVWLAYTAGSDGNWAKGSTTPPAPSALSAPTMTGVPTMPGVPNMPGVPTVPGVPAMPGLPPVLAGAPGVPAAPGTPGVPAAPGLPPLPPTAPAVLPPARVS